LNFPILPLFQNPRQKKFITKRHNPWFQNNRLLQITMKYSSNILRVEHFSEFYIFMDSFSTMLNVSRFNHKIIEFRNTLFLTMEFSIDING
jgi:hypothetical protein